jgi:hypothetical protein
VINSADKPFALNGHKYPSGTLIFKVHENPADLAERLTRLAQSSGAEIHSTSTGWVEEGVNFGSRSVVRLRQPVIAMAWDVPTSSTSAGAARFALEREFGYPVTPIRTSQLATADLSSFNVLILPDDTASRKYWDALGEQGIDRLDRWVENGGTVIGIAGAVSFLASEDVELLSVAPENSARSAKTLQARPRSEGHVAGQVLADEAQFRQAIVADEEQPEAAPGAILRARVDPDHWLTAGLKGTIDVLSQGRPIFTPIKLDKGVNAAVFQGPDQVVASGYLWKENREQIAHKPFVMTQPYGRGIVIGFTADPNYRGYTDGASLLFMNAVFRSPGHTGAPISEQE